MKLKLLLKRLLLTGLFVLLLPSTALSEEVKVLEKGGLQAPADKRISSNEALVRFVQSKPE